MMRSNSSFEVTGPVAKSLGDHGLPTALTSGSADSDEPVRPKNAPAPKPDGSSGPSVSEAPSTKSKPRSKSPTYWRTGA